MYIYTYGLYRIGPHHLQYSQNIKANKINTIPAVALSPDVALSSADMILFIQNDESPLFNTP